MRKIKQIRILSQSQHSHKYVELLVSLTKLVHNEKMVMAIVDYLVRGFELEDAAHINGVTRSNLSRSLNTLNEVAYKVEQINDLRFSSLN